jgi:type II secretion system (T2SS) protein G
MYPRWMPSLARRALVLLAVASCDYYESEEKRVAYARACVLDIRKAMLKHLSGRPCSDDIDWQREIGDQYPLRAMRGAQTEARDPWHHPYVLRCAPGGPVVTSFGADGAPGGKGVNADIVAGPGND